MKIDTKKLTVLGMMAAMSYIITFFIRIPLMPSAPFLNYDMKDIIIAMAGFIYGPLSAVILSVVVSVLELASVSDTGVIGLVMNVLSTCAFVVPPALIYKRNKKKGTAIIGLCIGVIFMTFVMVLWNYFLTPLYMKIPRQVVTTMLPTVFMPFNLMKGTINAVIVILIYKPIVNALRSVGLHDNQ